MIKPRTNDIEVSSEMNASGNRIIVLQRNGKLCYIFIQDLKIYRLFVDDTTPHAGDIYIARIDNINQSTGGCFAYVLPKVSVFINNFQQDDVLVLNRVYDGRLKQGDIFFARIKKEAYSNKVANAIALKKDECNFYNESRVYKPLTVLEKSNSFVINEISSIFGEQNFSVICDSDKTYEAVKTIFDKYNCEIKIHKENKISLNVIYGLKSKLERITEKKVWLKSGGYLFIEKTEAMTVIDVNSGKIQSKNREAGFLITSKEAIEEIVYQLGARNISGIIVVDMLKVNNEKDKTMLINEFKDGLSKLSPPGRLMDITKLGLFEISRAKISSDIYSQLDKLDKTILL